MLKNIVIVNDFDYVQGGASKVAIQTANMLAESNENLNVYFFSAVHSNESILNEKVIKISTNQPEAMKNKNKLKGFINGIYNFKAKEEFKKLLNTLNKEETIVHVHGWTKALSSCVFDIAFRMKFKVVLTLHDYFTACPNGGYFDYKQNKICKRKPLSWKCIKCNCDSRNYLFKLYRIIRQFIQNKIIKLPKKLEYAIGISNLSIEVLKPTLSPYIKLQKIYNPIEFDDNDEDVDYTQNEYYLFVGRVSKEKGIDIFCKAITELNLKGIVVGDGSERKRLEKKYTNIEFVGWKNKEDVKKYMKKARCLIFPSLWYEGAPLTPLESMSLGIPCLVNSCCAAREYYPKNNFSNYNELLKKIKIIDAEMIETTSYDFIYKFRTSEYVNNIKQYFEEVINE